MEKRQRKMARQRKKQRLINKLWFVPVLLLTLILVSWLRYVFPIFLKYLGVLQKLQRMGVECTKQSIVWLVCLIVTVYLTLKCIQEITWKISSKLSYNLNKQRRMHNKIIRFDQDDRILRQVLFEEMTEGKPMFDEEGLWETLGQMSLDALKDAREERKQILYEMEEAQKKGDMGLN